MKEGNAVTHCPHCGAEVQDTAKFCAYCGQPLAQPQHLTPPAETPVQPPGHPPKRRPSLRPLAIVLAVLIVALGVVIALILAQRGGGARSYDECMALAARYLEELDYEQAEALYLEAIQLDPSQVEAYRALAEMYVEQERLEDALDILARGIAATGSEELQQMYDELAASLAAEEEPETAPAPEPEPEPPDAQAILTQYLEDTLIPEYGLCDTGNWDWRGYRPESVDINRLNGIVTASLEDLDLDGVSELLLLRLSSAAETTIYLEVYEAEGGIPSLADSEFYVTSLFASNSLQTNLSLFLSETPEERPSVILYCYTVNPVTISEDIEVIRGFSYQNGQFEYQLASCYYLGADYTGIGVDYWAYWFEQAPSQDRIHDLSKYDFLEENGWSIVQKVGEKNGSYTGEEIAAYEAEQEEMFSAYCSRISDLLGLELNTRHLRTEDWSHAAPDQFQNADNFRWLTEIEYYSSIPLFSDPDERAMETTVTDHSSLGR